MYTIKDMPPIFDSELLSALRQCDTATIGHFESRGFLDPTIISLLPKAKIAGVAVTLSLPPEDGTLLSHALGLLRRDDVLIINRQGDNRHACWGEVLTTAAQEIGVAGVIIDGMATDMNAIQTKQFPVWARGISALTTKLAGIGGSMNESVTISSETVMPGDIVLADESGIVIIQRNNVERIIQTALKLQEQEQEILQRIRAGESLSDISGATKLLHSVNQKSN